ncbi:MAG: threonine--tRNA ligase [Bacilli bacterium]|nr:threonine--tRNA ligase [Bacilli bacterium]MDY6430933.1 threonine--tRNA ligase [Bacilli bacterium]
MKVVFKGKAAEFEEANGFVVAKKFEPETYKKFVAFVQNGVQHDLSEKVEEGEIEFIDISSREGFEILNHSSSHLMAQAIKHLYPQAKFGFGPAIEEGFYYDVDFGDQVLTDKDFAEIEAEMKKLSKAAIPFKRKNLSKEEAFEMFKDNEYKVERISELDGNISCYEQGDFVDLCRGPHVPNTSYIKYFKLLSLAGAYWRGDSKNKQLTRIYGTSRASEEELKEYLELVERRKLNDHRRLGKELGLFMLSDYAQGMPFFLPNGQIVMNELINYWREIHARENYLEIMTPTMMSKELWETSGHWAHYQDSMYTTEIDEKEYAIKPMNCPGAILAYKSDLHSYKELPLRLAELGHVHRYEASGALNGLFRVRAFTQDDAHIFVRLDQVEDEVKRIMALFDEVYDVFGLSYKIVLSTRPEDHIGEENFWDLSEKALAKACESSGHEFSINEGDGAFYGPKLDFKLKDANGRTWQCGTIQLDVNLPHRFECSYIDEHGEKVEPVMLHRVVFGSIERFIGILIEHFGGNFPTWLAPVQVCLLPVNNEAHLEYAKEVEKELKELGIRVKIDDSNEKLGYRLRAASVKKVPFTLVLGDKEKENRGVTYRKLGSAEQIPVSLDEFKVLIKDIIKNKVR